MPKFTLYRWTPFEHRKVELRAKPVQSWLDQWEAAGGEHWANSQYYVRIARSCQSPPGLPTITHLAIRRLNERPLQHSKWADLQRIKDELIGPEFTALEVYPAQRRLIDRANAYHLWVFDDPGFQLPFGLMAEKQSNCGKWVGVNL